MSLIQTILFTLNAQTMSYSFMSMKYIYKCVIYPEKGPKTRILFGMENIAHLAQVTIEAFNALQWDIPE